MKRKLNIKNLTPRKDSRHKQGYYKLVNPEKYIGDPHKIIFRSSWEQRFATYCDNNERIVKWSSEPLEIPYLNPLSRTVKPYNVDFYVKLQRSENEFEEFIVEVKPQKFLKEPNKPKGRISEKKLNSYNEAMKAYIINIAKFDAAKKWASERGWEFIVVTEKFIF